jgi:hypothetical protein
VVDQLTELDRSINDGLAANWPKKLRHSGPIEVAFDFHDRPYYGKQEQEEALYVRVKPKTGRPVSIKSRQLTPSFTGIE